MTAPQSAESASEALRAIKMVNRLIRRAKAKPLGLVYGPMSRYPNGTKRSDFAKMRIFATSDAGYASLPGGKSIESGLLIMCIEISRGGTISCEGSAVGTFPRRISRCARPNLAAEATAVAHTVELALWQRTAVGEIIFGILIDNQPVDLDPLSMCNPFDPWMGRQEETTMESCCWADSQISHNCFFETGECKIQDWSDGRIYSDGEVYKKRTDDLNDNVRLGKSNRATEQLEIIALDDCANVFTSAVSLQPRTRGKLAKITLSFIRDLVGSVHFSYLGAHFNISDFGTKHGGNDGILRRICEERRFNIGFLAEEK